MKAFIPLLCLIALPLWAQNAPEGWAVYPTQKPYAELVDATKAAIKENGLIVVTQAGPTKAAAARGISIPGNRVIGAFNNDYAVRVLETSVHAMIEAPIRFYVTENKDGTANLSYKTPSFVFAPYASEGGQNLMDIAAELDSTFQSIAERAVK
ncbi:MULTISPECIES: DUF302 domain-containing protein [unclassified Ruegeria]|uniref:DUF302 domain-containing protein n=1 Tax=unclassified Ruegeria TaxID=2625375 RepID=UPI001491B680|nr:MULTISPECIES: DUF302 domain-containing protein [unclassified Ruegeria]NOC45223.1 DUF302 domain-containing protein [Ruegeria sp. HKCCD7559]NOC81837.1 DUF302 domain-containing protein [Ruegeria sp. HKCCD6428]NOD83977.1 DUF302 domain-containing protein [Ruegeria sp. HKCCD6119]